MLRGLGIDRIEGHSFVPDLLGPDSLVIDCGMNEGSFALAIQRRIGCRVIGAEPNAALAEANRTLRGLDCHTLAITRTEGPVRFHVDEADSTASSIVGDDAAADAAGTVVVPGLPLHVFLRNLGVPKVDLLKLDIEGAELDVFATCPIEILQAIPQITVEFHAFLHPGQRGPALDIIARMRRSGFYALDFSRNLMNVLFINQALRPVSTLEKGLLLAQKYRDGIGRVLEQRRAQARGHDQAA